MSKITLSTLAVILAQIAFYQQIYAQEIIGLWEVKAVKVGDQEMTPVAKWTRINGDGSYTSGNGWLQNSEGTWDPESNDNTFLPKETKGIADNNGPFQVSFIGNDTMFWQRLEDGEHVQVRWERIEKLPKSTADEVAGLWSLMEVKRDDVSQLPVDHASNKSYKFNRWDRIYIEQTSEGESVTGYWHIDRHKPEITFISQDGTLPAQTWQVTVSENDTLELTGISDNNRDMHYMYKRIDQFPE